jgi:subtilisin family serine protease
MAQFIIKMEAHITDGTANIIAAGATVIKQYKIPGMYLIQAEASELEQISGLASAEDVSKTLSVSHAYDTYDISHLKTLGFDLAGRAGWHPLDSSLGDGVVIYLVDTGINKDHNEFVDANIQDLFLGNELSSYQDSTGHGTGVSSLIVGKNIGVSPNAVIQNVKIFENTNGSILVTEIIDALDAIVDHHTQIGVDILKIVCLPWVTNKNQLIDQAIANLLNLKLLVVSAAGNNGAEVDLFSPGGLDSVITVGSIDQKYSVTSFTNMPYTQTASSEVKTVSLKSAKIDIFSLGVDIDVADHTSMSSYKKGAGTSLSTALVAGVLAHYVKLYPGSDPDIIRGYLYTKGYRSASRPTSAIEGFNKPLLLDFNNVTIPTDYYLDFANINYSIAVAPQTTEVSFVSRPSGRLVNVKKGEVVNTSLGIRSDASDVLVLEFTPLSPWMSLDLETGDITLDLENNTDVAVGVYHFAIKGTISDTVGVAEYAVGVYENDISELETASEYYYDTDSETYEEAEPSDLVAFSSAK